ncbi:MAG TPA: hypothetical protein VM510_07865 [Caulifigura sp.]|nr:hypothetical protein [Caulifigura sp.]
MNSQNLDQFGQLLARLSDETLTQEEALRLNEILKEHPASQEHLLDHMFVDGLLQHEFGGRIPDGVSLVPPAKRVSALRKRGAKLLQHRWPIVAGTLACAMFAAVTYFQFVRRSVRYDLDLVNSGFEATHPIVADVSGGLGGWYGDVAHVVGEHNGVVPIEGSKMVRFVKSADEPRQMCEVNQVIDLDKAFPTLKRRPTAVEAAALFNAIPGAGDENECSFGVTIYAYDVLPSEHPESWPLQSDPPLSFGGRQATADADVQSWQEVKATLQLPEHTRFLVIQLSATRPDHHGEEFPGHFADQASVSLVCR